MLLNASRMALEATASSAAYSVSSIVIIVIMLVIMYFMMIRPQQKQEKEKAAMISALAVGDTVRTTGGFIGTIVTINDNMVIIEFGNNKNCRIPMYKEAIVQVEKPEDAVKPVETKSKKK